MTSDEIDRHIKAFAATISREPLGLAHHLPFEGAGAYQCFENARRKAAQDGGKVRYGWYFLYRIVEGLTDGGYLIAGHHAVWQAPDGHLFDVTPFHPEERHRPYAPGGHVLFLVDSEAEPFRSGNVTAPLPSRFFAISDNASLMAHVQKLAADEQENCRKLYAEAGTRADVQRRDMTEDAPPQRIEFKLNPDLVMWIDQQGEKLLGAIADHTDRAKEKAPQVPSHPDRPKGVILDDSNIVGEPIRWQVLPGGKRVSYFFRHRDRTYGLVDDALADALKVAERIWQRKELHDCVGVETIEDLLLKSARDTYRGQTVEPLSVQIERILATEVKATTVLIPLEWMSLEADFHFGDGTFVNLTKSDLDAAFLRARSKLSSDGGNVHLQKKLHDRYVGHPALKFQITADQNRAEEIAIQRAKDYMALLQPFCAASMIPNLVSLVAPAGGQPPQTVHIIRFLDDNVGFAERMADHPWRLEMTVGLLHQLSKAGLGIVSELAKGPKSPYEKELLQSLLVYGRACYQHDPADKLLQIMTAVEMFALKSPSEPIAFAVADRVAFSVSSDPDRRRAAAENFRAVYALRSKRAHHGQSLSDLDEIEIFLKNAWAFFFNALRNTRKFQDRIEYLDHFETLKYGGAKP